MNWIMTILSIKFLEKKQYMPAFPLEWLPLPRSETLPTLPLPDAWHWVLREATP